MAKIATPWSKQRELLDNALDSLRKYGVDPEWRDLPNYETRVGKNVEAARAAFGNLLTMVAALPIKK